MKVFGSSGTRGVVNREVTVEFVLRVAKAAGAASNAGRVALARDTRATGQMLANAAASGLASVGKDVDRLGIVPTPGLQAYCERESVPGVMITASHNPPEYNGVKLIGACGRELSVGDLERVERIIAEEAFEGVPWQRIGEDRRIEGARRAYVEELLDAVDRDRIAAANPRVALDPGHGAGALTSPDFFRRLGCDVVTVNAQVDGRFPGRDPEPIPENLGDLRGLVRATGADVGIAHDGDADRATFVDETGAYVEGSAVLAALAAAELEADDVTVSAVNVSQRLVDVAAAADARLDLTPIGSTRIVTRINELETGGDRVPVAGEGNGGIIFPEYRLARDGAYTAAKFLELLARTDETAGEAIAPYDDYHNVRRNIRYGSEAERESLLAGARLRAEESDAEVTTIDGYRLDYGDAWVLARPSGTEPLVRIYAEARGRSRAEGLAEELAGAMKNATAEV